MGQASTGGVGTPAVAVPPATVVDLASRVEYVAGSIVSRILGVGSVTLFAFDAGQALNEHTAPIDALVQVLDGTCTVRIGGVAHGLRAGQAILMPANLPHALHADTRFKMLLTMLKPSGGCG